MTTPLLVFDLETTDKDPREARIVTAYLGILDASGTVVQEQGWLVNPGIPIPPETTEIHGVTDEMAAAGVAPAVAIAQILQIIYAECRRGGLPLAGQNLAYDLTVMDAEIRRYPGNTTNYAALYVDGITILDSLVIDKAIDKWRKGSRKLIDMAAHYGVPITEEEAHSASFDAVAAGRIIQRQTTYRPLLAKHGVHSLADLGRKMPVWAQQQADSYAEWRRSAKAGEQQDTSFKAEQGWPIRRAAA